MRIYAFVDLHGHKKALTKIVSRCKKKDIDLVVSAGDHTIFGDSEEEILKELDSIGKPVLMIHGNHEEGAEMKARIVKYKNIYFIHSGYFRIGNYIFIGWGGGGFSYIDPRLEKKIPKFKKWKKENEKMILVTHAPAYKTKVDKIYKEHAGSKTIRKLIEESKPLLAISGHLHETAGKMDKIKKTLVVNPGYKGKVFEI